MPTYVHQCTNSDCSFEWEDVYSIATSPPEICPKCEQKTAKRVISGMGLSRVELTGQELVDKVKSETEQLKRDMKKDTKLYASLLGEDRYHQLQTKMDRQKKEGAFRRKG